MERMEKQTAVEFIKSELKRLGILDNGEVMTKIFEQAKAMEKNQHNETWDSAHQAGRFEGKGIAEENWQTFETHWEETFKSE